MKLFQTSQKYFENYGIISLQMSKNHLFNTKNVITSSVFCLDIVSASAFLLYEAHTFYEYADSVYSTSCVENSFVIYLVIFWKMRKFFKFIKKIESLVESRMRTNEAKEIYEKTSQTVEKLSETIVRTMRVSFHVFIWPPFITTVLNYFAKEDMGPDAFEMPFPLSFPFDWRTPTGYLFGFAFQVATAFYVAFAGAYHASFIAGTCLMLISLAQDLKKDLLTVNRLAKHRRNRVKLFQKLSRSVRFHSNCKHLIDDFTDLYGLVFLSFFMWSYFSICGTFLKINYEIAQPVPDIALLATAAFEGFWAFGFIVFFCEFGNHVFNAYDDLNMAIDQFDWFLFPIEIQKMLPLLMVGCQKTSSIQCFGDVPCIRDTSKKVLSGTFSYFMVLREFEM